MYVRARQKVLSKLLGLLIQQFFKDHVLQSGRLKLLVERR
jgi:hypothetical protein